MGDFGIELGGGGGGVIALLKWNSVARNCFDLICVFCFIFFHKIICISYMSVTECVQYSCITSKVCLIWFTVEYNVLLGKTFGLLQNLHFFNPTNLSNLIHEAKIKEWLSKFSKNRLSICWLSICQKLVRLSTCRLSIFRLSICRLSIIRPPIN